MTTTTEVRPLPDLPTLIAGGIAGAAVLPLLAAAVAIHLDGRGVFLGGLLLLVAVLATLPNTWAWASGSRTRIAGWVAAGFGALTLLLTLTAAFAAGSDRPDVVAAAVFLATWTAVPVGGYVLYARYSRMPRR